MKNLASPLELVKRGIKLYFQKQSLFYLVKVILLSFAVYGLAGLPAVILWALASLVSALMGVSVPFVISILSIVLAVFGIIYGVAWTGSAYVLAITKIAEGKIIGARQTFKEARTILWRVIGTSGLVSLIVLVGYILFIVPGLVFSVWYSFAVFIAITEGAHVVNAIKKSKELVKGYFWPVAGRLLVFMLLSIVIQLVGSVRQLESIASILSVVLIPLFMLLPYLLYKDLRRVKGI